MATPKRVSQRRRLLNDYILEDVHDYRVDRHTFTVYASGDPHDEGDFEGNHGVEPGVTHHMANRFEMNLDILSGIDRRRPILVDLSSCGGDWVQGMKMFGAILTCPNPVTVLGTSWCRSMTSLIPLAADRFVMRPPARYMYHHGTMAFSGLVQEADTEHEEMVMARDLMLRIYVARLREQGHYRAWSRSRIRAMLEENMRRKVDVWLSVDEAVRAGFVDAVYEGDDSTLRVQKRNARRRRTMMAVLRQPMAPRNPG